MESHDRLIVAPAAGVFRPDPELVGNAGVPIQVGQVVGSLRCGADTVAVESVFAGTSRDILAWRGERVRPYQPLVWLEVG